MGGAMNKKPLSLARLAFAAACLLAAAPAGAADSKFVQCKRYSGLALAAAYQNQFHRCGFAGDRWRRELKFHADWCSSLADADWHYMHEELQKRLDMLRSCTARISQWDSESTTRSGGTFSPSPYGEGQCKAFGQQIMNDVNAVKKDPSLWRRATELGDGRPSHYLEYGHWNGFRCRLVNRVAGTKSYQLEGYTGRPGVGVTPKPRGMRF